MDQEALREYLAGVLGERVEIVAVRPLGGQDAEGKDPKGLGYGVPFEVECRVGSDVRRLVVARTRVAQGFGHEYPADRAWQAIYGHAAYNGFPAHVRSVDVGFARRSGALVSAGDAAEFFQLVAVPGVPVRVPRASADRELLEVLPPFFAFRALVVAHPRWYPTLEAPLRARLLRFARDVMACAALYAESMLELLEGRGDAA